MHQGYVSITATHITEYVPLTLIQSRPPQYAVGDRVHIVHPPVTAAAAPPPPTPRLLANRAASANTAFPLAENLILTTQPITSAHTVGPTSLILTSLTPSSTYLVTAIGPPATNVASNEYTYTLAPISPVTLTVSSSDMLVPAPLQLTDIVTKDRGIEAGELLFKIVGIKMANTGGGAGGRRLKYLLRDTVGIEEWVDGEEAGLKKVEDERARREWREL
jgi:hypothetical protein